MTDKREIACTASDFLRSLPIAKDDGQFAAHVRVPETLLDAWFRGDVTMPDGKLFLLAAILEQHTRTTSDSYAAETGSLY